MPTVYVETTIPSYLARSAPLMFRIPPLQLRLDPRVMLAPEIRQVLGHLHGSHAGRQDVYAERYPPECNSGRRCHTKQFLYRIEIYGDPAASYITLGVRPLGRVTRSGACFSSNSRWLPESHDCTTGLTSRFLRSL